MDETEEIITILKKRFTGVLVPTGKDICYATQNRQDAVKAMARVDDLILVVGSTTSSNSNRLREVAEKQGVRAYLVNDKEGIDPSWIKGVTVLGITSGASVPEELVAGVVSFFAQPKVEIEELVTINESLIHFALPKELLKLSPSLHIRS